MSAPSNGNIGTVYLLHFHSPLGHARHYLGWTSLPLEERLSRHDGKHGAAILRALKRAGIGYEVAAVYEKVDRNFERKLKNRKKTPQLCPICRKERLEERRLPCS